MPCKEINLFVYGTLMSGFRANKMIPKDAIMYTGKISGNLYHYIAGYPVAVIVKDRLSYQGTLHYENDIRKQISLNKNHLPKSLPKHTEYGSVCGELYSFPYDEDILSRLDSYEGFSPDSKISLYKRTLVPVELENGSLLWGWVYNMDYPPYHTALVPSGSWRDCFYSDGSLKSEYSFPE